MDQSEGFLLSGPAVTDSCSLLRRTMVIDFFFCGDETVQIASAESVCVFVPVGLLQVDLRTPSGPSPGPGSPQMGLCCWVWM